MRKLASIQVIESLEPIEGADRISKASMKDLGWECVVKKGDYKVGDMIVYCEEDSVLPQKPEYEFLKQHKYRIKIRKYKGQVSQGLILPLTCLPNDNYKIDQDVTELMGIVKYEDETEIDSEYRKNDSKFVKFFKKLFYKHFKKYFKKKDPNWPSFLVKTDETRIQTMGRALRDFNDRKVHITEKCDGQSVSMFYKKKEFGVCSRNQQNYDKNSALWVIAKKYEVEKALKSYYKECKEEICIQGELCGPKIQKNKYELKQLTYYIFNIFDINKRINWTYEEIYQFCCKYNLDIVPDLGFDKLSYTVPEWVEKSKGNSKLNSKVPREGIVVRVEDTNVIMSLKVINPDFNLKYNG